MIEVYTININIMIDISKFSGKERSELKSEILHSSGHAQLGRGGQIGSTSNQSFQQRVDMTQQQSRTIADYKRSAIGSRFGVLKAKKATPRTSRLRRSAAPMDGDANGSVGSRQAFNAGDTPPEKPSTTFKEPPSRGFNPYA